MCHQDQFCTMMPNPVIPSEPAAHRSLGFLDVITTRPSGRSVMTGYLETTLLLLTEHSDISRVV